MKRNWAFVFALVITVVLFAMIAALLAEEEFDAVSSVREEFYWCVLEEEMVPRRDADALLTADGMLFLYYEDYGLVNVYSAEGEFLRGYQVGNFDNGVGGIGYQDGVLYIDGRVSGIYGLRGDELVIFEGDVRDEGYQRLRRIVAAPDPAADGGYTYYYNAEANRVDRSKPGEPLETVVQLPRKDSNVESLFFVMGAVWIVFAIFDWKVRAL